MGARPENSAKAAETAMLAMLRILVLEGCIASLGGVLSGGT
jgi:hypothetical protein